MTVGCIPRRLALLLFCTVLQVGYDLTEGLPGRMGEVVVTATGGSDAVVTTDSSSLAAGLFVKLDGEAYEIASVDSATQFTLVEVCDVAWCCVLMLLLLLLLLLLQLPLLLVCSVQLRRSG